MLAQPGARKPSSARFFRGQMQTIISRALSDLGIAPVPSRRCFTLMSEPPRCPPLLLLSSALLRGCTEQ